MNRFYEEQKNLKREKARKNFKKIRDYIDIRI
jgi:hypothetical protein